jgi:hypothetical protein
LGFERSYSLETLLGSGADFPRGFLEHALDVRVSAAFARGVVGALAAHFLLAAGIAGAGHTVERFVGFDRLVWLLHSVSVGGGSAVGLAGAVGGGQGGAGVVGALDGVGLALALVHGVVDGGHDGADGLGVALVGVGLIAHQTT